MSSHPLTNFELQKYYRNKPWFNVVYSRNNFPEVKDWVYALNHNECKSIGTHKRTLRVNGDNVTYFFSFWVEHIVKDF